MSTLKPRMNYQAAPQKSAPTGAPASARRGAGSWIITIMLASLLVATDFIAYLGWILEGGIKVSTAGHVAMAARVLFLLAVGCGLMALIFYSSRSGSDEPPIFITPENGPEGSSPCGLATKGLK